MLIRMNYQKVKTATFPLTFSFCLVARTRGQFTSSDESTYAQKRLVQAQKTIFYASHRASRRRKPSHIFPASTRGRRSRELVDNSRVRTSPERQKKTGTSAEDDILRKRKASSAKTTFNHFSKLIILLRRANSWTIHEFGRVNVRQKKTGTRPVFFWRRRRDSNSCYGFPILLP